MDKNIIDSISKLKLQLIINKSLYMDNTIELEVYEKVESNLLNKINNLSNELERV